MNRILTNSRLRFSISLYLGLLISQIWLPVFAPAIDVDIFAFSCYLACVCLLVVKEYSNPLWKYFGLSLFFSMPFLFSFFQNAQIETPADFGKMHIFGTILLLLLCFVVNCLYYVPNGSKGFIFDKYKSTKELPCGWGLKFPWTNIFVISFRPYRISNHICCRSINLEFDYTFECTLNPKELSGLYFKFKDITPKRFLERKIHSIIQKQANGLRYDAFEKDLREVTQLQKKFLEAIVVRTDSRLYSEKSLQLTNIEFS